MKQEITNDAQLILIVGDLHIPHRIHDIPEEIKKILIKKANKFNHILCTGNIGNSDSYQWLKNLCINPNNFNCVRGENVNSSNENPEKMLPESFTIKIGDFTITLINGYQIVPWGDIESLSVVQKSNGSDIVISGYTHIPQVLFYENKYFVNPGSLSGAYSPLDNGPQPSFMLIAINGEFGIIYQYELNPSTKIFDISKVDITKNKNE